MQFRISDPGEWKHDNQFCVRIIWCDGKRFRFTNWLPTSKVSEFTPSQKNVFVVCYLSELVETEWLSPSLPNQRLPCWVHESNREWKHQSFRTDISEHNKDDRGRYMSTHEGETEKPGEVTFLNAVLRLHRCALVSVTNSAAHTQK